MPMNVRGGKEMQARMRAKAREIREAMLEGVDEFNRIELNEMRRRVPVDTGELRDSGYYLPAKIEGDRVKGFIGFTADHALIVHEDLEAFHRVGEAKYVESVLNEARPHFAERVMNYVKRATGL